MTDNLFTIDRTVPPEKQEWREHLVLVSTLPSRFLGLLHPADRVAALELGRPFRLFKVATYFCNIALQQGPKGVTLSTVPHTVLKYDLIDTLEVLHVISAQHVVQVHQQSEIMKTWMYEHYLDLLDAPRLATSLIEFPSR